MAIEPSLVAHGKRSDGEAKCASPAPGAEPANASRKMEDSPGSFATIPKTRVPTALSDAELKPQTCVGECDSGDWGPAYPMDHLAIARL